MASANNDISESIALITTANTIAQDPTTVGQGIKTMSLRIRSTKTELEQMGEDAEGAAENVSKLREQMLALTGVDIQLDENTYKSTYQILLEISKVWAQLDDMAQASVLEQLFGKRQANIGAAILENGELLEKVYKSASNSAGSAMREQEEYAKSIQYSIDSLKAAYQGLAQDIMSNDFLKGLVDTGADLIDVLDKIIDKFGLIPPLVASIGAVGSINGVGFFKTIESDATKSGKALALLGKSFSDIKNDYQAITDDKLGFKKIGNALSGVFGFSSSDIASIKEYNKLIESGVGKTEAMEKAMSGASVGAKQLVQNSKTATVSITGLSVSEKAATVATEALGFALNTALSFGIGLLIQGIITGITKLVNAEEEAAEKAQEMQEQAAEAAKNYLDEKQSLEDLTDEYVSLATTTSNLADEKQRLLSIQDKMNQSISTQAEKVDLLNKSLTENLRLTAEQEYKEAKKILSESQTEAATEHLEVYFTDEAIEVGKEVEQEFLDFLNAEHGDIAKLWSDMLLPQGDTLEEMVENYQEIIDLYGEWEGHNNEIRDQMVTIQKSASKTLENNLNAKEAVKQATDYIKDYDEAYGGELGGRIGKILESARDLSATLNESDNVTERYSATQQIKDLEIEARSLIGTNTILREQVDSVFGAIDAGITKTISSSDDLWSAFYDNLDDVRKKQLDNIDKIEKAMQSIASGENLSHDDFWGISQLDTDHIIQGIEVINGKFKVSGEQLKTIKDDYIAGIIEGLKEENALTEQNIKNTRKELELAKTALQVQIASGVNSAGDAALVKAKQDAVIALEKSLNDYDSQLVRNTTLIREFETHLGYTADMVDALQKQADNYQKAFEAKIDGIIDGLNSEKEAIQESKTALEEQLKVLEEQEDELKEIISNYEKVADLVNDTIQTEIDSIQEAYDKQIEALKSQNEEREEALDLAKKLADLENAKNNKVVTYTEAGGFQYGVSKEAVESAQKEYDNALNDAEIKRLEEERDSSIKSLEEYAKKWSAISKKSEKEESEKLATDILGSDWREKIANQDLDILDEYESEYDDYGKKLNQISNIEKVNLEKSIKIKDEEIKAKEAQIKEWNNYKTHVKADIEAIKNSQEEYADYLDSIKLSEASNLEEREKAYSEFKDKYTAIVQEIIDVTEKLNGTSATIDVKTNIEQISDEMMEFILNYGDAIKKMGESLEEGHASVNSAFDAKLVEAWKALKRFAGGEGYASGGTASYTGMAMLHGTQQKSEVIFNAAQSRSLYDMVKSGNFANLVASKAMDGFRIAQNRSDVVNNRNASIVFTGNTINLPNVQNPEQFAKQMERYIQTTLTESQIIPPRA